MSEISKAYEPQSVEDKWYQFWLDQKCFVADPARVSPRRPAYSIVIPPPNVTGVLTMGHVLNNTIQDILARKARMDGKEVLWLPGTDHAGIATQTVVEKVLKKSGTIRHRDDLGREKFLEHVWQWKEKHGGIIIQQLKKLGASCDWTRERFTMDPEYSRCVQKVFVELYKKGLIYRGKRMVNWDPAARTALSDEEVDMIEEKGHLWHIKYPLLDDKGRPQADEFVVVATTRPETMLGDEAVAVNPNDPRYTKLVRRKILLPLQNKPIPVIADELVDPKFGTGCVKVTPAHDPADYEMAVRHKLPFTVVIGPDGRMTKEAGKDFDGMDRMKARQAVVEKLTEQGLLLKTEDYVHNVGYSQRSHVPIEPYLSEQWFLKYPSVEKSRACVELEGSAPASGAAVSALADGSGRSKSREAMGAGDRTSAADEASAAARGARALPGKMRFHPQRWAKVYDHWMGNIQDWCISRQLWWGHRIPVWYNQPGLGRLDTKKVAVIELEKDLISRPTLHDARDAAWLFLEKRGWLNKAFRNLDTGYDFIVTKSGLKHAFSHPGIENIIAATVLPDLIRTAVFVGETWHEPRIPEIKRVLQLFAAMRYEGALIAVKITVKEYQDGSRVYDHEAEKITASDGKSPERRSEDGVLRDRPTSDADISLRQLIPDVNREAAFTRVQERQPGDGWAQDPDVLDTWFSSWLWPFATMGWIGNKSQNSNNPTLRAFYPTTDLVTGPDIIFFWVARMIMAGYEFMGEMPFKNVYFTGIIRDKQGRKMSKSLGNSPDPLDLINKYGADALRFGTMRSAPLGQDILFDEQNVELGRNFCNKLWNACRFRQMMSSAAVPAAPGLEGKIKEGRRDACATFEVQAEINPALLTSDDKWILLKLDQAIREITEAFAEYKFSDATATLYRFFWSEYCDWYVEASKAVLGSAAAPAAPVSAPLTGTSMAKNVEVEATSTAREARALPEQNARKANTLAVIDFVLSHTLRLFHPFLPFITEELWHGMGYAEDMPENQGGKTIMFAPWPKPLDDDFKGHYGLDDCYLEIAGAKYDLVTEGRNLRRMANIAANKKVKFILKPAHKLAAHDIEVLKLLLNAEAFEVSADYQPGKNTLTVRAELGDLFLPLEGLIDKEAETARLKKELEKIEAEAAKVEQKLANPNFTQKVPVNVLQEHQQRLAEWQSKREHVKSALAALQG
jgi:valyl-tRNA synthetase